VPPGVVEEELRYGAISGDALKLAGLKQLGDLVVAGLPRHR
jgi:hypothetical protein